ncbi:hypothetical protein JAAARDRAFT_676428 [Jaapia argillacea MUCL 33604]|uniref:NADH:flavin oxidoreductase/NADH oxidase N-terminal domain-containing protein n=1 Tax=Jaapia argillacea MUCL 33604 TaxID=933084 RepID=A0A067Q7V3_9AGAM|nr:hypothetical protein JAAARDRAFT_676428 [Jaapia argillacea MUCL 33604]
MYEHGSTFLGGPPNEYHHSLYTRWSSGRWGMIITGNVQVSSTHLTLGRDMVVPASLTSETTEPFKSLAAAIHSSSPDTLAIMQLSHAGRQSPNILGGRLPFVPPLAPSAVQLGSTNRRSSSIGQLVYNFLFQTPRQMLTEDIDNVVVEFVRGATLAAESGFDGAELHASHGYLLAQFISPKTNKRSDEYSLKDALHLLRRMVSSIRAVVPPTFAIGVKLNAADYTDDDSGANDEKGCTRATPSSEETRALGHVSEIASWGMVDFIEISGGDYENPKFMEAKSSPRSSRQALFSKFSKRAMSVLPSHAETNSTTLSSSTRPPPLILLTGGLTTYERFRTCLESNHAHLLGVGRLSILCPELPRLLHSTSNIDSFLTDIPSPSFESRFLDRAWRRLDRILGMPRLIGAGLGMAWYVVMMRRMVEDQGEGGDLGGVDAAVKMWLWTAPSAKRSMDWGVWTWTLISLLVVGFAVAYIVF